MRWVISTAAFLVPMLVMISIGGTLADQGGSAAPPLLGGPGLAELRRYVEIQSAIIDRYAAAPGAPDAQAMPHLVLERFDLMGSGAAGQAWYRLARPGQAGACGLLRRRAEADPPAIAGARPTRIIPLSRGWSYWETAPAAEPERRSGPGVP